MIEKPLEIYAKIQAMVQKDAEDIAKKVYNKEATQYGVSKTPLHYHNDVDSPKIPEDNIVLTNKLQTQLTVDDSETFFIRNVKNVSRISFYGFAYDSSSSPAVLKANVNGEIIFGRCNDFTGSGSVITVSTNPPGTPFVQTSNYTYLDGGTLANVRVGSAPYMAYVANNSGTEVASLFLDTLENDTLQFTSVVASNWIITGIMTIE